MRPPTLIPRKNATYLIPLERFTKKFYQIVSRVRLAYSQILDFGQREKPKWVVGILLLLAVEIISTVIIIGTSAAKSVNPQVLGKQIAQAEEPPADAPPPDPPPADSPPPAESTPPAPESAPAPAPEPASATPTEPSPSEPFVTPTNDYPENPAAPPSPSEQAPESLSPESQTPQGETSNQPAGDSLLNPQDYSSAQTMALVEAAQLLSSPENIDEQTQNQTKVEEEKIDQAQTPKDQANLLLDFVQDKVTQINLQSDQNDFATTNFQALRLASQIERIQSLVTSLPKDQALQINSELQAFCNRSDFTLKSTELIVPEESGVDLEITRGVCLSTNL